MHTLLLRASGEFELEAVMDSKRVSGVEHGELLSQLVDAVIARQWETVDALREEAIQTMGAQQTVDALGVVAGFNGITRIADATGIPLDAGPAESTAQMRDELRIDDFEYDEKSRRYAELAA